MNISISSMFFFELNKIGNAVDVLQVFNNTVPRHIYVHNSKSTLISFINTLIMDV